MFTPNLVPTLAAKNVQCKISSAYVVMTSWIILQIYSGIHTSISKGTMKRNCHQDWLMGRCGRVQEAAGPRPKGKMKKNENFVYFSFEIVFPSGSHGLCPHFYNAAFTHDFYATKNILRCTSRRLVEKFPDFFKMGYMETRKR